MSVQNGTFTRTNSFGQDGARNYPRFFSESVQDMVASEREGRPIYKDEERVEIIMPGNPMTRPVHRVNNEHKERWPKEYEAFRAGQEISPDGTPLEQWPLLKRAQVLELKALGFVTVEQLSVMDDHAMQRIPMFGRRIKELAGAFLNDAEATQLSARLSADNERKEQEISALKRQVEELGSMVSTMYTQLQALRNAPSAVDAMIPGMFDPIEQAKQGRAMPDGANSSLDNLAKPRRGRPPNQSATA